MNEVDEIALQVMARGVKWRKGEAYRLIEVRELRRLLVLAKQAQNGHTQDTRTEADLNHS